MQRVFNFLFFAGLVGGMVLSNNINQADAFSLSPSPMRINNVHSQYPITKQITVGRLNDARAVDVEVQKQGRDAASIQLSTEKFTIQAGEKYFTYEFILDAKDAEPGEKEAQVVFVGTEQGSAGSGLALRIGLTDKMSWSVTTTVLRDVELRDFTSDKADGRFGSWERKLSFYVKNNGNVTEDITEVKYSFFKKGELVIEKTADFKKSILPFSYIQADLPFNRWQLRRGQNYEARITMKMTDGREISENKSLTLLYDQLFAQKRRALSGSGISKLYEEVKLCAEEVFEKFLDLFG